MAIKGDGSSLTIALRGNYAQAAWATVTPDVRLSLAKIFIMLAYLYFLHVIHHTSRAAHPFYFSQLSSSVKNCFRLNISVPFSLCQGNTLFCTTMIFLNESYIFSNGRSSCAIFSSSGTAYADWMYYRLSPLFATKSTSIRLCTFFPSTFSTTSITPTSTSHPLRNNSMYITFSMICVSSY